MVFPSLFFEENPIQTETELRHCQKHAKLIKLYVHRAQVDCYTSAILFLKLPILTIQMWSRIA